ncbi:hypothetical protein DES53_11588 [Roseimicrobium gellanilyticum]|uniref:Uncharacterized protein n=1 Tax=Roseimicrobium gellanilyticum TaxID=748857 RepID=A0A366H6B2_9BACT|nr:hypothetical protein [Roseimicrobium gellanilyticum]RBP36947.1 hypothetical protein DES53_11588 [Roseimicrobium gellanilyticum]
MQTPSAHRTHTLGWSLAVVGTILLYLLGVPIMEKRIGMPFKIKAVVLYGCPKWFHALATPWRWTRDHTPLGKVLKPYDAWCERTFVDESR